MWLGVVVGGHQVTAVLYPHLAVCQLEMRNCLAPTGPLVAAVEQGVSERSSPGLPRVIC